MEAMRIGTRRRVNDHALSLHHQLDPVHVVAVADRDAGVHAVLPHDGGHAASGSYRVLTLRLGNKSRFGDAASDQIVAPYLAFAVARIAARAAGSDEHGRSAAGKEIGGVIQPGTVGGRRLAGILGGAKNYDHIGWVGFIRGGLALDAGA